MTKLAALLAAAAALAAARAPAGVLQTPLEDAELILWSRPMQVDFWIPAEVVVLDNPIAPLLADTRGRVLYAFHCDEDFASSPHRDTCARVLQRIGRPVKAGQPRCVAACALEHPPLLATPGSSAQGDWTLVERDDGARQWAFKGHPLYRYRHDDVPGYPAGTQSGGVWEHMQANGQFPRSMARNRAARAAAAPEAPPYSGPPGVRLQAAGDRTVLADYRGMTLYSAAAAGQPAAQRAPPAIDLGRWKPLAAPALATPLHAWTIVQSHDGLRQWAYQGRPVYSCGSDGKPGDVNCADATWSALAAAP